MASPFNPPFKGHAFQTRIGLSDTATAGSLTVNPTIAAGDFKVDIDGAGFTNLTNIPTVSPSGGRAVLISLTGLEMNGYIITVRGIDQTATKEWADVLFTILTVE